MRFLPSQDSFALAASRRRELDISRERAARLGQTESIPPEPANPS